MQTFKTLTRSQAFTYQIRCSFSTTSTTKPKRRFGLFTPAPPLPNLSNFYDLRIYKHASFTSLLHTFVTNSIARRSFFSSRSIRIHDIATQFLGKTITNSVFFCTFAEIYGARSELTSLKKDLVNLNDKNISVQVSYRMGTRHFSETELEDNARKYIQIVEVAGGTSYKDNSVSVNIGALCNNDILTKLNRTQSWIESVFERGQGRNVEKVTANVIYEKLQQKYVECDESEVAQFLSEVLKREVSDNLHNEEVTRVEWLLNLHAFDVNNTSNNENKIVKQLNRLTDEEVQLTQTFYARVKSILERARQLNISAVTFEVENQDFRAVNDSVSLQFATSENQNKAFVLRQIVSDSRLEERARLEEEFLQGAGERRLGLKLVSQTRGEENTEAFEGTVRRILSDLRTGDQVVLKANKLESVAVLKKLLDGKKLDNRGSGVKFVQVEGTGDYLSHSLMRDGYGIVKELYYGDKGDLVPWLVEENQRNVGHVISRRIENKLIINELLRRARLI